MPHGHTYWTLCAPQLRGRLCGSLCRTELVNCSCSHTRLLRQAVGCYLNGGTAQRFQQLENT